MNLSIVTTTINSPTLATHKFCEIASERNWNFYIIGDTKTPHSEYNELTNKYGKNIHYLDPTYQSEKYSELSDLIGWKTIQRRNIGFVHAYNEGADIIATVDDDNIPYDTWGTNIYVGKTISVDTYTPKNETVFDPLSITKNNHLWHRGYPIDFLDSKNDVIYNGKTKVKVDVQADLWDGDPDIDAMARLTYKSIVKYSEITSPYRSPAMSPFNSQNTFLSRAMFPCYSVLPFIGRMDDIWASYMLQKETYCNIIYGPATVYQARNVQDLITNLEKEIIGYRNTSKLMFESIVGMYKMLPETTNKFIDVYRKSFKD